VLVVTCDDYGVPECLSHVNSCILLLAVVARGPDSYAKLMPTLVNTCKNHANLWF